MTQDERDPTSFVSPQSVSDEGRLIELADAVVVDSRQEVELVQDVVDGDADVEVGSLSDVAFQNFRHRFKLESSFLKIKRLKNRIAMKRQRM